MPDAGAAGELLRFLDRRLFAPIIEADPETVAAGERTAFDELQEQFRRLRDRLAACPTATDLVTGFDQLWHADTAVAARRGRAAE